MEEEGQSSSLASLLGGRCTCMVLHVWHYYMNRPNDGPNRQRTTQLAHSLPGLQPSVPPLGGSLAGRSNRGTFARFIFIHLHPCVLRTQVICWPSCPRPRQGRRLGRPLMRKERASSPCSTSTRTMSPTCWTTCSHHRVCARACMWEHAPHMARAVTTKIPTPCLPQRWMGPHCRAPRRAATPEWKRTTCSEGEPVRPSAA